MRSYPTHLQRSDRRRSAGPPNEARHRAGELLVHRADWTVAIGTALRDGHAREVPLPARLGYPPDHPILRFAVPPWVSAMQLVARLRQVAGRPDARIAPNYVFTPTRIRMPMPAGPAHLTTLQLVPTPDPPYSGLRVGLVDTGVVLEHGEPHPYLAGRVSFEACDEDSIDSDGDGRLDVHDGHGTFVAGRILEHAPGASVRTVRALDTGLTDDLDLADDLALAAALRTLVEQGITLINVSMGSAVDGGRRPLAVAEEIENLDPDVVVVAAAGNEGRRLPVWPAAFEQVVAVGAVDERGVRPGRLPPAAPWSNVGSWVDACAGGVDVLGPLYSFDEKRRHDGDDAETFTGWATWSGTSFAAPKVTGRIAQLAMEEEISPRQAAELLVRDPDLPTIPGLGTYVG